MKERVYIFDTTLRDGEQTPGVSLQVHEKVEIARQLVRLGVDVIEAGFPAASEGDFEAVKTIANSVEGITVAALARANQSDVERAYEALQGAKRSRLHVFIATSDIHLEYKLKKTREEVLEIITNILAFAQGKFDEIEFSAEDASRTDLDYLCEVFGTAIAGGATILNVPDTVGYMTPEEFGNRIRYIKEHTPHIEKAIISVHCHDDLGLANANTLAAVAAGARQVECTVNGLGERAGNAAVEEVVMAMKTRQDIYTFETRIDTTQFMRTSRVISNLCAVPVAPNKAIVGANAFAHESGIHQHGVLNNPTTYEIMTPESVGVEKTNIVLGKHSGRHAFEEHLANLGFHLEAERLEKIFKEFKDLADKKKEVFDEDIVALVLSTSAKGAAYTMLEHTYESNAHGYASAYIRIQTPEGIRMDAAIGDGPVDASFKALDRVLETGVELVDYHIQAVTSGNDALGEAMVTIAERGRQFKGRGISTDIIQSSVKAYVNAVNTMMMARELDAERARFEAEGAHRGAI